MTGIIDWDPTTRVRELSEQMVAWGSETGSAGEAAFADLLAELMRTIPYFQNHPHHILLLDSHGDPVRKNLVAVVLGKGQRTVALAGHYDVVAVENYRDLAPLAFNPNELLLQLVADLESRELSAHERRALDDLRSGDFLPGRGMLDMKSGLAAGIAVLEAFANDPDRSGNLIFMTTPDEERGSRGMRSLRDALPAVARQFDLVVEAGINLDSTSDQGDGQEGRAIYRGSIGKALPFAFVVGQSSHAGYPFEGVSAAMIAAEIVRAVEANPELCDVTDGEISPPPICLETKDLRGGYEVTTPERVWVAFNWLSHAWKPGALFERFTRVVEAAANRAVENFNTRAASYAQALATPQAAPAGLPRVLSVAELRNELQRFGGAQALARISALEAKLNDCDDPLALTRQVVDAMASEAGLTGPAIVVGFGSLLYPAVHLRGVGRHDLFCKAIEEARTAFQEAGGPSIKYREFFTGISDMSFFGHRPDATDSAIVTANTPASALVDATANQDLLAFPVVNIGPWGREFHQRLERVYMPYAFRDMPQLIRAIVDRYLKGES